jgi:flagellin
MYLLSASLSLQRNVKTARGDLERSMERLSSGLRIVRAADDAAGMAIATSLRARLDSRDAAIRNIHDALSATDVADGGLQEIADTLSRLRQLAVQSASETLDDTSRSYLHQESRQLLNQIDTTAQTAIYGDASTLSYPGVDVGLVIDTSGSMFGEILRVKESITDFQQQFISARYNVQIGLAEYRNTADTGDNTVRHTNIGGTTLLDDLDNLVVAGGSVDPYAAMTEVTGITNIAGQTDPDGFSFRSGAVKVLILITDSKRQADFIAGTESQSDVAGWLADESIQVHAITPPGVAGDYSTIAATTSGGMHDIGNTGGSNIPTALDDIANAIIDQLDQAEPRTFHIGINGTDSITTPFPLDMSVVGLSLGSLDLTTVDGARAGLDSIDAAIDMIGESMGKVGGLYRRLESALATQISSQESEAAALSSIVDLDYARESTEFASAQLRMNAAIAAMAQARALDEDNARRLIAE